MVPESERLVLTPTQPWMAGGVFAHNSASLGGANVATIADPALNLTSFCSHCVYEVDNTTSGYDNSQGFATGTDAGHRTGSRSIALRLACAVVCSYPHEYQSLLEYPLSMGAPRRCC